jgi:hypothetical protein
LLAFDGQHAGAGQHAASGCAPPMPPRPGGQDPLAGQVAVVVLAPASAKVSNVPCTMPCVPM